MEQEPKPRSRLNLPGLLSLGLLLAVLCLSGTRSMAAETVPTVKAPDRAVGETMLIPMGRAVGIKLFSDGVLVVGLSPVETASGDRFPGRDCGLKEGDLITGVNGTEVDTIEEVQAALAEREGEQLTIQAVRGQRRLELTAAPVENERGVYQLGVWLRDSMAGIGTMTFYDPGTGIFGALGHGINDVDTATLMPLESGSIMRAQVSEVKKGVSGTPGELHGQFDLSEDVGSLYANTQTGIFGQLDREKFQLDGMAPIPVARREEIREGDAEILSNIQGDRTEKFKVKITHVSREGSGTRDLMIQVTDPRLLEETGGIVQGMSGSPVIQNGRIVGAVTHVLVNDPTRGYGIFIENMLEAAENTK